MFNPNFLPAYIISNEDLRWATAQTPNATRVLTTAGSGDQALFYHLSGTQHIDTFDITNFANVIQDIKTTAIPMLTRNEYIYTLCKLYNSPDIMQNTHMPKIVKHMPSQSAQMAIQHATSNPFHSGLHIEYYPQNLPTPDEYRKLQATLKSPFNFILGDLSELHTKISGEYDVINLSNIFDKQYTRTEQANIIANLIKKLKVGGKIIYLPQYQQYKYDNLKLQWKSGISGEYTKTLRNPSDKFSKMVIFQRTR